MFYHVCFAVPDIEAAMADLTRSVGVRWSTVLEDSIAQWDYRMAFSCDGPPYFELVQGPPGSPWDAAGGARCHHLGYWTEDVTAASQRLAEQGFAAGFSGCPFGRPYTYHAVESLGVSLELMDVSRQERFLSTWVPGGARMQPLERTGER